MKRLLITAVAILLAACASDPAKRQDVAEVEAARMQPTAVPLGQFGRFELQPMESSELVTSRPEKAEIAKQLEQKLVARLQPLLSGWESTASPDAASRTLVIKPKLASLHVVSGGARFWAGGFGGDSFIDMDLVLIDKSDGRVIANQRITRNANAMVGAWSVGASDRNLADYIVDIAHQYLSENHRPAH